MFPVAQPESSHPATLTSMTVDIADQTDAQPRPMASVSGKLVAAAALVVFLGPAVALAAAVIVQSLEARPHVESLRATAEAAGLELTPDSVFAVDHAPADQIPPGAIEQDALIDKGLDTFHGNPVSPTVLYWPLLIVGSSLLTLWALVALLVAGWIGGRLGAVAGSTTVAVIGLLWLPLLYFGDVINVVSYYID